MNVLLRKELRELWRTRRFVFLPVLFAVFGISGPVLIRLLPTILKSAGGQGVPVEIPTMGPADALLQYLSMTRQLGYLAIILVFMGIVAGERKEGTLTVLFVKPVSRLTYLWSRWLVNGAYVLVSVIIGSALATVYTALLVGAPDVRAMVVATVLYLAHTLLLFSWTTWFSTLMKGSAAAAGLSVIPLFVVPLLGYLWKPLGVYGPYGAVAAGTTSLGGLAGPAVAVPASAWVSAGLDVILAGALVFAAYASLRRTEL
jgi:ABC-2 type transport system permease protein